MTRTACNMLHRSALQYFPTHYLQRWAFTKYGDNHLGNTIENVSLQAMKHNRSSEAETSAIDEGYRISLLVSRAAIEFMDNGAFAVSSVLRGKRKPLRSDRHCLSDLDIIIQFDAYDFAKSMANKFGQKSDAPEHVLSTAAYLGDISLVEHLLEQGVDVNARSNIFGPPLRNAALRGHLEIARLLLNRGANADDGCLPGTEEGWQVVKEQYCKKTSFEKWIPGPTDYPYTAVEAAARNGHKEILQLLLQPEFGVSRSSYSYLRSITFAAIGGDAEMFRILTETANYSAISEETLQDLWYFSLRHAAASGNIETIPLLLDKGAEINREHNYEDQLERSTPLGRAAFNGRNEAISLLLQKGADINGGRIYPLYLAIKEGVSPDCGVAVRPGCWSRFCRIYVFRSCSPVWPFRYRPIIFLKRVCIRCLMGLILKNVTCTVWENC